MIGRKNVTADLLSRVEALQAVQAINFEALADAQKIDQEILDIVHGKSTKSLQLKLFTIPGSSNALYCVCSNNTIRPFVTIGFRDKNLAATPNLSHPRTRTTARFMTQRFVCPNIRKDRVAFAWSCIECQRAKVVRHTQSLVARFSTSDSRFAHINIKIVGPFPPSDSQRYCLTVAVARSDSRHDGSTIAKTLATG